jgi:cell division protein FtsB
MSTHLEVERKELRDLVGKAALKEQRILRFSILFTLAAIGVGFVWISYSANRVIRLEQRRTNLEATNKYLESEINQKKETLRQVDLELDLIGPALTKLAEGKIDKPEAVRALASVSNAKERLHEIISQPPTNRPIEGPSPTPTPPTTVPDLRGLSLADAREKLSHAQLTVTQRVQEGRSDPGKVLYQDPIPGTRVPVGSSVIVYIAPVMVPAITGLTVAAARERVRAVGLVVIQKQQDGRATPGTILYQDPTPGTRLPAGAPVILYVSTGPK